MPDIHFECPKCGQALDAPEELVTQLIDCPTCKGVIEVPICSMRPKPPKPLEPAPKPTLLPPPTASTSKARTLKPTSITHRRQSATGLVAFISAVLILAGVGLAIAGFFLASSGLIGQADMGTPYVFYDELKNVHDAIRRFHYAVQYGSGLMVIALGLILAAVAGLLNKGSN